MSMSNNLQAVPSEKSAVGQALGPLVYASPGFYVPVNELAFVTRVKSVRCNNSAFEARFEGTIGGAAGQQNGVRVRVFNSVPSLAHAPHAHPVTAIAGVGGGLPLSAEATNTLADGAGTTNIPGGVPAAGGVQDTTEAAHAATPGSEVAPGTNLNGVTFVVEAAGF